MLQFLQHVGNRLRLYRALVCAITILLAPGVAIARNAEVHHQVLAIPEKGAYTGVCAHFGEEHGHAMHAVIEKIEKMTKTTGKHPAVIAYGDFWGEQHFSEKNARIVTDSGAIPLIFWAPWDKPYTRDRMPDKFNLYNILGGMWDNYIDQWAEAAKNFGKPLLVSWGFDMNSDGFPWSVYYYGGGQDDITQKETGYFGPELFKQAYRYVVNRVRAKGVHNIEWVFQVAANAYPSGRWNRYAIYYPGPKYVDWLGLSVNGKISNTTRATTFYQTYKKSYDALCKADASKPVMIMMWETENTPDSNALWLQKAFGDVKGHFPRIKIAVWGHNWMQPENTPHDHRRNACSETFHMYREEIKDPYWIDTPRYRPIK